MTKYLNEDPNILRKMLSEVMPPLINSIHWDKVDIFTTLAGLKKISLQLLTKTFFRNSISPLEQSCFSFCSALC